MCVLSVQPVTHYLCCCVQAGLSGAIAIHAIYGLDETVLFFERPHVGAANSGVTPNPYLTVSIFSSLRCKVQSLFAAHACHILVLSNLELGQHIVITSLSPMHTETHTVKGHSCIAWLLAACSWLTYDLVWSL